MPVLCCAYDVRQMIMSGCAAFAQVVGSTRIEAELLPQWWEQVRCIYLCVEYQAGLTLFKTR